MDITVHAEVSGGGYHSFSIKRNCSYFEILQKAAAVVQVAPFEIQLEYGYPLDHAWTVLGSSPGELMYVYVLPYYLTTSSFFPQES